VEGRLTGGGAMFRRDGGGDGVEGDSRKTCTSRRALEGCLNDERRMGGTRCNDSPKGEYRRRRGDVERWLRWAESGADGSESFS
jgi:hypothetical protein